MSASSPVVVGPEAPLPLPAVVAVAREGRPAVLAPKARQAMEESRALVEARVAAAGPVYGLNTGVGALADTRISPTEGRELQRNLLRSHAAGAGELLPAEVVRAMMLLRARALATGRSGVRPVVAERLLELLNAGITPAVPSRGSVGASGDLAPLAHIGLCLLGEGRVLRGDGGAEPAARALRRAGIEPLELEAKEGLALVNGTEGMLALGVLALHDAGGLLAAADLTAAMSVEAALGTDRPFAEDLMALRPHPGQVASAANLRALLAGSAIIASHRESPHAVQDPYSMRCAPQVHGAARDAASHLREVVERELASVTDNPVVLPDGRIESTGNFHGQPLAGALDYLALAVVGLAGASERRTAWLLARAQARGLPPFLSTRPGLRSGYMLAQYTQAALVAEARLLGSPASLQSVPTSGDQEDHVSMGWLAGLKLRAVLDHLATVLAVEALCAAQALDLRAPLAPARGTAAARRALRERVPFLEEDRDVSRDIAAARDLVLGGRLVAAAEEEVGHLR